MPDNPSPEQVDSQGKIRVLLVEDSPLALVVMKRMLAADPEIEVVGTAPNGKAALALIPQARPQVIATDLHMPVMDGLELTRAVMEKCPLPILVVSCSTQEGEDPDSIFTLLEAGALDVFPKPMLDSPEDYQRFGKALAEKIKLLSGVFVFSRHQARKPAPAPRLDAGAVASAAPRIIAIGSSTGGPQALQQILTQLPADFPLPLLCVQHISNGFLCGLVSWLASQCKVNVRIARDGETPLPGNVYFADENAHLQVDSEGKLAYSAAPAMGGHRPSVTVLFRSVARHYGSAAAGVLLSGMGNDGAEGMLAIAKAGGSTIAQDEASCVVFGMPKEAIRLGAAASVLPLSQIAASLIRLGSGSAVK